MLASLVFGLAAIVGVGTGASNGPRLPLCSVIWRPWVREDPLRYVIIETHGDTIPATVWRAPYRLGVPPDSVMSRPVPGVVVYGQSARVVRSVGFADSAAHGDVALVEWFVDSMCTPIPPPRIHRALSLPPGTSALLVSAPRADTIAPDGVMVLNLFVGTRFYAPALERGALPRSWRRLWRRPKVLTIEEYESLLSSLSTSAEWEHAPAQALETLETWARAHPDLARREPARAILRGAREDVEARVARHAGAPWAQTRRLSATRALPAFSASPP